MALIRNKQLKIFNKIIEKLFIYIKKNITFSLKKFFSITQEIWFSECIQDLVSWKTLIKNSECILIYDHVISNNFPYNVFYSL